MRSHPVRSVGIIAAAACALFLTGCGSDFYVPVTGTTYGTILLPGGTPAPGVNVIVEGTNLRDVTDANGRFVINNVPSVIEGQIGEYYNIRGEYETSGQSLAFVKIHFKVKEQQSYSIGRVTLEPTGTIRGSVALGGSSDASGVEVFLEGLSFRTVTNAAGEYRLDRVPVFGAYAVVSRHDGYQDQRVTDVAVEPAGETVLVATVLLPIN